MQWWEYVIIAIVALFAITVAIVGVIRKKQGKSSCSGDCSCCPYCSSHCKNK